MSEKKKNNKTAVVKTIVLMIIIVLIGLVIWFLTSKHETRITTTSNGSDYSVLECSASHPDDPFFVSETAQRFTHFLKVMFADDELKEISYRYEGTYNNNEQAKNADAWLHGDYNEYMGSVGVNPESLNPVFMPSKTKLTISLYAEAKKINSAVARLFFIKEEEFSKTSKYKSDDYRKMYESKGFTCTKSD